METFTFKPNWGMSLTKSPKVKTLSFGDGYEQRLQQGLNHNLRQYSLTFSGTPQHINKIENFLDKHAGYKAFFWTPTGSSTGKFKCEKWSMEQSESFSRLSCEFKEVIA